TVTAEPVEGSDPGPTVPVTISFVAPSMSDWAFSDASRFQASIAALSGLSGNESVGRVGGMIGSLGSAPAEAEVPRPIPTMAAADNSTEVRIRGEVLIISTPFRRDRFLRIVETRRAGAPETQ